MFSMYHLKRDTYYIDTPTNIGVYKLNNKDCILIDTCYKGVLTDRLLDTLSHYNLNVKAILHTHAHVDHFGSDSLIKSKYNCTISAPEIEYIYIENPHFTNLLVYNTSPFSSVRNIYPEGVKVDYLFDDSIILDGVVFSTLALDGHSQNHKGIITPDNVIFTGDAFLDVDELEKAKMLYNYDVDNTINSLKKLSSTSFDMYVPSHGKVLAHVKDTIQYNIETLEKNANLLLQIIQNSPMHLEELMSILVTKYKITQQTTQYLIAQSCVTSLLSYLENKGLIGISFNNGFMKFTAIK